MPQKHSSHRRVRGNALEQFAALSWGHAPRQSVPVEARHMRVRQVLVALGRGARLRALHFADGTILRPSRPYPWLAVGALDNRLYVVGGSIATMARAGAWGRPGTSRVIVRTDYDATKKGERVYWYHDHEPTYPRLVVARDGYPIVSGGTYRVSPAGIVG